jgi:hypothetical protein
LIAWNRVDSPGPEFGQPTLGRHGPFLINIRVWHVQGAKEGVNHDDALFYRERGGLLNDLICAVHKNTSIISIKAYHGMIYFAEWIFAAACPVKTRLILSPGTRRRTGKRSTFPWRVK